MTCKLITAAAVLGMISLSVSALQAQGTRSGSTTSGLFGSRTLGGSSQQASGSSLFSGGTRSSGVGSSATTQDLQAGTVTGGERYLNANRDATRSFVGVDASEVRGVGNVGNSGAQAQGFQNAFNQFRQLNQFQQQFQNQNGQNSPTQVRIGLALGFTPSVTPPTIRTAAVTARLGRLPGIEFVGAPLITLAGRTAVVQGTVASERDRELVSRLLLLEPGISAVQNEMTIAPVSADPG